MKNKKVYDIGLVCEIEGSGKQVLIDGTDSEVLLLAQYALFGAIDAHKDYYKQCIGDKDFDEYETSRAKTIVSECDAAIEAVRKCKSIDELESVKLEESMLVVSVWHRELLKMPNEPKEGA